MHCCGGRKHESSLQEPCWSLWVSTLGLEGSIAIIVLLVYCLLLSSAPAQCKFVNSFQTAILELFEANPLHLEPNNPLLKFSPNRLPTHTRAATDPSPLSASSTSPALPMPATLHPLHCNNHCNPARPVIPRCNSASLQMSPPHLPLWALCRSCPARSRSTAAPASCTASLVKTAGTNSRCGPIVSCHRKSYHCIASQISQSQSQSQSRLHFAAA